MVDPTPEVRPASRFWLYTPFALLGAVAIAWSAAWFVIRTEAEKQIDAWIVREAAIGRNWICEKRSLGGFPFRIETACESLTLTRGDLTAKMGRVRAVAQVYAPYHVIAEIDGPLVVTDGDLRVEANWQLFETSIRATWQGLQRASFVAQEPQIRIAEAAFQNATPSLDLALTSEHLELHVRPNPARLQEQAYDLSLQTQNARIPILDALMGGTEPTTIEIEATVTRMQGFTRRLVIDELERWRVAGGVLEAQRLSLTKGSRRLEARGILHLDEARRLAGELNASSAGLGGLIGALTGGGPAANLLGALLGQSPLEPRGPESGSLVPLPPLKFSDGRMFVGPVMVPRLRLPALY